MEKMASYEAIHFPADERSPHLVPLITSNATSFSSHGESSQQPLLPIGKVPHPEMYMDFIAEGVGTLGWKTHVIEMLDGMNKKFTSPYVIFYPVLSRDGMPFPINKCLREIQGPNFREAIAWRGNLIIAKCRDEQLSAFMDASMADFPILKNYLSKHYPPRVSATVLQPPAP